MTSDGDNAPRRESTGTAPSRAQTAVAHPPAADATSNGRPERVHLLTVAVEDFFHATALAPVVPSHHWGRFDSRVASNLERALELLDEHRHKATFFVLGWVADRMPEIPRRIAEAGHEVASKGFEPRTIRQMSRATFRADAARAKDVIEQATGIEVLGHRVARGTLSLDDLWALDTLAELGFRYDSSIYPRLRSVAAQKWRRFPHLHRAGDRRIQEMPLSTWGSDAFLVPAAGGNYIRQLPAVLMHRAFRRWDDRYKAPFNAYFHIWELDPEMPRIATAGLSKRLRQYRNLERMPALLRHYFESYRFQPIREALALESRAITIAGAAQLSSDATPTAIATEAKAVSIVIPCFNEAQVLPFLRNALQELEDRLQPAYKPTLLFVDDASTDETWLQLERLFGGRDGVRLLRHETNAGVAHAILTGIRAAVDPVVCSLDCDCSYDPRQLESMIPMLTDDVTLVTASPYHADGAVLNVPGWRLFLSRNLSRLYRLILHSKLATYTSCFRVYRRADLLGIEVSRGGFLGVAELLARLDLQGRTIVECPAVLEPRMLGRSKMRIVKTIRGHLLLIAEMARLRIATPKR